MHIILNRNIQTTVDKDVLTILTGNTKKTVITRQNVGLIHIENNNVVMFFEQGIIELQDLHELHMQDIETWL